MDGPAPGLIAWAGETTYAEILGAELERLARAARRGIAGIHEGPAGQGPNFEVVVREEPDIGDGWWIVRLRDGATTIQSGDDTNRCYVSLDQIVDTCGYSGADEPLCRASALAHAELTSRLVQRTGRWIVDDDVDDRLVGIARELAIHALAVRGPAHEAHVMIHADGPFNLGRASGFVSMTQTAPGAMPPTVSPAFLGHVRSTIGHAVRVSVEAPGLAVIGSLTASALVPSDPMLILRELSEGSARLRWTT